jgi:hypothetical protein
MAASSSSLLNKAGRFGLDIARNNLPGFRTAESACGTVKNVCVTLYSLLVFAYACFFRPIGKKDGSQQARLDAVSAQTLVIGTETNGRTVLRDSSSRFAKCGSSAFVSTESRTVYDATRTRLLKGRHTLLRLCAAHLRQMKQANPNKPLVWVDIGGGTGMISLYWHGPPFRLISYSKLRLQHRGDGQVLPCLRV